ncbi:hypothetical protein [Craterilacuibacter sp. RT1T]|uniref:hypothetical protein n=1 Tax=Craterilacuibacter sp. RT1T TaxID=2942211 RepID=UPI0020BFBB54|nr:hypothetical protein [Craterilacuibacter sp. RT1T]MCL6262289.1 hypothetical protein [Craterilacuibacter sp. RT1T]
MRPLLTTLDTPALGKKGRLAEPVVAAARTGSLAAASDTENRSQRESAVSGWRYSTQLNQQLTSAQQSLDFVDQLLRRLELLKSDLGRELGSRRIEKEPLQARADEVGAQWAQREAKTDGTLDGQLHFQVTGQVRQRFSLRGMDLSALTQGKAETLVLIGPERGVPPAVVAVGEGVDEKTLLQRFNRALGGMGVRAEVDDGGALAFSVEETALARLREGLMVRGEGVRFPAGSPQRVRLETESGPFQLPWQLDDHAGVRQSLQRVVSIIAQVQQSRAAILSAIAEAEHSISRLVSMDEQSWAQGFVADFNARLNQRDAYQGYYEILPALSGVSRYRVLSLLSLR